ncbi:hypothetical protein JCM16303_003018 [Sporobolomyces ruberrimus]
MISLLSLPIFSAFLTSTFAAPLAPRADTGACSPRFDGNFTTQLRLNHDPSLAWQWGGENPTETYPTNVYVAELGDKVPNPAGATFNISQWYGSNREYRIGVGKFDGVETCLSGRYDQLSGADCASPLSAWTIVCSSCYDNEYQNGLPEGPCYFESTSVGTCASFTDRNEAMNLTTCKPILSGNPAAEYPQYQSFIVSSINAVQRPPGSDNEA